ncbi:MAG: hypothetical protein GTO41_23055 [Burkholderiales bacterium]|nr:hypothetical protein [Burkholderiales bacterium]
MANLTPHMRKWLGAAMIVAAIVIVLSILFSPAAAFYGQGFHHGMRGYGHHRYGNHMSMPDIMWHGWGAVRSMRDDVAMIPRMNMMTWLAYDEDFEFSDEQKRRFRDIQQQLENKRGMLLEQLLVEQRKLSDLMQADMPEPKHVGEQYARCADLRRQILELETGHWLQVEGLLTDEQRDELKGRRHYWMMFGRGY